jgi:hypothetical protein
MTRTLIAVKSCWRDLNRGDHDVVRNTWGRDAWHTPFDARFFMGEKDMALLILDDEIQLDCSDDYDSLPHKTRQILAWSTDQDYDHTFLCDTDTYIIPRLLAGCHYEDYDIAGRFGAMPALGSTFNYRDARGTYPNSHPWPSGGVGYFVSKLAAKLIVASEPTVWAEDMHVGQVLGPLIQAGQIKAVDIPDFECRIAWHFPRREYGGRSYDPATGWMQKMHREHR